VDVYGVGVLIRGESGIGKSEIALSLIEKGHRLISDDLVMLKKIGPEALIAMPNEVNKHFLSLRGVGLVNVIMLYGSGAFQKETRVNMDILLSPWDPTITYDAMGMEEKRVNYMGIQVEHHEIPIRPGRDIATLIEVSAKNWRLRQDKYFALQEFLGRVDAKREEEGQE
jgi:HPr kinase/phosphorylase